MRAGTRPHAATARASERAHVLGSIWLLLAQKTSEMKSFAGTRLSFERAAREQLERSTLLAAAHARSIDVAASLFTGNGSS